MSEMLNTSETASPGLHYGGVSLRPGVPVLRVEEPVFDRCHLRIDAAMLAAAHGLTGLYQGSWVLNRIANDRGRLIGAMMMLELHFSRGRQGFTVAELRAEAQRCGVASPNRMTALAGLLRASGYLAYIPTADARKRTLAPTKLLIDLHRRRLRALMAGTVIIHPDSAGGLAALEDEACVAQMEQVFLSCWRAGTFGEAAETGLASFADRDAGFSLLCLLMCGEASGQSFRITDLSRYFVISRTHTLVVMRAAMRLGLAERAADGGAYRGTPLLRRVLRPVFQRLFDLQAEVVSAAQPHRGVSAGAVPHA